MDRYYLTNKAVEDLSQIWNYTYEKWSERQADKYYQVLTDSFREISYNPALGKYYPEIDPNIFGLRVGRHIIFYRKISEHKIEIVRILHERMDLKSRIKE